MSDAANRAHPKPRIKRVSAPIRNSLLDGSGVMVLWRCAGDGVTGLGLDPLDAWEKWVSERKYRQCMGPLRQC